MFAFIVIATVWNSLVAWLFIAIWSVFIGLVFHNWTSWDWAPAIVWWGIVLAVGYLSIWKEETGG